MANISSIGIGSGVLTSDLIEQLAQAEREPTEKRLDAEEEGLGAQLSEVSRLKNAISDLRLTSRLLGNPDAVKSNTVTSSNAGISGTATEKASTGQYSIQVDKLAAANSLASGVYADKDTTALGTGTLSISVGGVAKNITIDGTNNTLEGIANAINGQANLGASASVLFTGSGYQLVLTAKEAGLSNAVSLSVTDSDGNSADDSGLSQLTNGALALTEVVPASDLAIKVNGVDITRESNTVDDLVKGVTFEFTEETTTAATVKITRDTETVTERVQELVDKYNALQEIIAETTKFDPSTGEAGIFLGEAAVRNIAQQARGVIYGMVRGLENANVRSLADIGISTDKDTGLLSFDSSRFKDRLNKYPDDVTALFADQGRTTDSQVTFLKAGANTKVGAYDINITQAATQGAYTGNVALGATVDVDADNNTFSLRVNGIASGTITLDANTYSREDLVTEIQSQLDADGNLSAAGASVRVSLDASNQLVFTSTKYGSASAVEFLSVGTNTAAELGFDLGSGTAGLDVAGTINGKEATGSGRQLSAASEDDSSGIVVEVTGTATGDRGKVSYIEGVADQMIKATTNFIGFEGLLTSFESRLNAELSNIGEERFALERRITSLTERLSRQFTAADILVSQFKNIENFLGTQLAALNPGKKE